MKNIVKLVAPEEVHDYVMNLWSDGLIKQSHQDGGIVYEVIDQFAQMPRIFFDASDSKLEWTHFSTWWGAIVHAEYDNPVIRDLRYLHEIYHGATFPYKAGLTIEEMRERNFQNEREASVFTEIAIYLALEGLREQSFPHAIFADSLIEMPSWKALWANDRHFTMKCLIEHRARIVDDLTDTSDPQLIWLQRYREQEQRWVDIWRNRYNEVDVAMIKLRDNKDKQNSLDHHLEWLDSVSTNDIPFYEEAVSFRSAYDELLIEYNDAMEKVGSLPVAYRN